MKKILGQYLADLIKVPNKTDSKEAKKMIAINKTNQILMMSVLSYASTHTKKSIVELIEKKIDYLELKNINNKIAFSKSIANKLEYKLGLLNINFGIKEDDIIFNNTTEDFIKDIVKSMIDINTSTGEYNPEYDTFKTHMTQCLNKTSWQLPTLKKFDEEKGRSLIVDLYDRVENNFYIKSVGYDKFCEIISYAIIPIAGICKDEEIFDNFKNLIVNKYYQDINNINFNYNLYTNIELSTYKEKIKKEHLDFDEQTISLRKKEAKEILNNMIDEITNKLNIELEYNTNKRPENINVQMLENIIDLKIKEQIETKKHEYKDHSIAYIKGMINITALIIDKKISNNIQQELIKVDNSLKTVRYDKNKLKSK